MTTDTPRYPICVLSKEFKVLCEIYHHNINNDTMWPERVVQIFKYSIPHREVMQILETLFNWGFIRYTYGEDDHGNNVTTIIEIDNRYGGGPGALLEIYDLCWRPYRTVWVSECNPYKKILMDKIYRER